MRPSAAGPGWGKTLSPQGFSGVWGWCWHSVTVLQTPSSPYEEQWGGSEQRHGPTQCAQAGGLKGPGDHGMCQQGDTNSCAFASLSKCLFSAPPTCRAFIYQQSLGS